MKIKIFESIFGVASLSKTVNHIKKCWYNVYLVQKPLWIHWKFMKNNNNEN